jgi:chromosome partitioning protein
MRVVVVGASKGGVGKTTLSAALAVESQRLGYRVGLLDLDTLQSRARWNDLRRDHGGKEGLEFIKPKASMNRLIGEAQRMMLDWLIVDTAPGLHSVVKDAIDVADICIVPVRPSPLDVQSIDLLLKLCEASDCSTLVVLNATMPKSSMTSGARAYLDARKWRVWKGEISYDEAHAHAMMSGRTASELMSKSIGAEQIAALWRTVEETCRTSVLQSEHRKRKPRGRKRS